MNSDTKNNLARSFFTCLIIGAAITIFITVMGLNNIWQTASAGLVLCYAFIVWKDEDKTEENIDSIYYLGFIFTILSLLVSLIPLSAQGSDLSAHSVLGAFSVALSTTLVGITAKIMIGQHDFDDSSIDVEEEIRSFSRAVHTVTSSLNIVSEDIKRQNDNLVGTYSKQSELLAADFKLFQETLAKATEQQTQMLIDNHNLYLKSLSDASSSAVKMVKNVVEPSVKELQDKNIELSHSMDSMVSSFDMVVPKLEKHFDKLNGFLDSSIVKNQSSMEKQNRLSEVNVEQLLSISNAVKTLKEDIVSLSSELKNIHFNVDSNKLSSEIEELTNKMSTLNNIEFKGLDDKLSAPIELLANKTDDRISKLIEEIDTNASSLLSKANEAESINLKLTQSINDSSKKIIESLKQ
ncbi:hypothetical protein AB4524_00695 [Vibrio breoganii]